MHHNHPNTHTVPTPMALRIHLVSPKPVPYFSRFPGNPCPPTVHLITASQRLQISVSCTRNNRFTDSELALKLAAEVEKMNAQMVQREEALNKSRELLFKEFSNYLGLEAEEVKKRWMKMSEDDKWVLVRGFVSEWGSNFHPLSAKSVKGLVDEYLVKDIHVQSGSAAMLFPSLKRLMRFTQNNKG